MTAYTTELTEEGRALFQQRVALFAKVMIGVQLLGLAGLVALSRWAPPAWTITPEELWQPWFALFQVQTGLAVAAWALCRRGVRSMRFVSWVEATMLLGTAALSATMGRLIQPGLVPKYLGDVVSPNDALYGHFVGLVQGSNSLEFVIGLSLWVFVRAALVPSRPLRTLVLTALVAVPVAVVTAVNTLPFEPQPSLRSVTPRELVMTNVTNIAIWWTFVTGVCTIVSVVIFGLRRQVREARRLGQYTLEEKLGEGGMGTVYRASHAMMRRPTAIKLVRPDQAGETSLARFEREVQLTARLTHPNTVTIFDYGRTEDGIFYYAMELLDGATLKDIVRVDGPQPPGRVVKVLADLAGALQEAHGISLIHRDIKPSNVILCTQGGKPDVAKLLDFGLVKELGDKGEIELTEKGVLAGTPQYMCPESLTSPNAVDERGDLYTLGAVGYFMLTGQHVFDGATIVEVCGHHLHSEPVAPSKRLEGPVPEDLEDLLLSCLKKDPADRPQSAAELGSSLQACQSMGEWAEADAHRWWDRHGESLRLLSEAHYGRAETQALAVDLARYVPSQRKG
ncbi:MAG: serine/threonine protein kinase [Gemmatimonadota bacterium]|nr:MAG: serine/threonine protein kinase [Gemmatimonadota bacterium]